MQPDVTASEVRVAYCLLANKILLEDRDLARSQSAGIQAGWTVPGLPAEQDARAGLEKLPFATQLLKRSEKGMCRYRCHRHRQADTHFCNHHSQDI